MSPIMTCRSQANAFHLRVQGHHITSYMRAIPQDTEPAPIIWSYVDLNLQTLGSARLLKTHGPPPPLQLPSPSSSHPPAVSPSTQPPAEEGTPPAAGPGSQSTLPHSAAPATQVWHFVPAIGLYHTLQVLRELNAGGLPGAGAGAMWPRSLLSGCK